MCSDFVTSHGEFPFLFKTGGDLKVHAPGRRQGSSSAACAQICAKPPAPPSRNEGVNGGCRRFRVGEGTPAHHPRACVRACCERARVAGWRGLLSSEPPRASSLRSQQQPRTHHHHHPPPPHLPHHSPG